ncbi:MAG: hypothetical protein ACXWJA_01735 [Caldimonas sp.]
MKARATSPASYAISPPTQAHRARDLGVNEVSRSSACASVRCCRAAAFVEAQLRVRRAAQSLSKQVAVGQRSRQRDGAHRDVAALAELGQVAVVGGHLQQLVDSQRRIVVRLLVEQGHAAVENLQRCHQGLAVTDLGDHEAEEAA